MDEVKNDVNNPVEEEKKEETTPTENSTTEEKKEEEHETKNVLEMDEEPGQVDNA